MSEKASTALGVTVLVPAYNDGATVGETVHSLLSQTRAPVEVIVIDLGSSDGTAAVARAAGARVVSPPAEERSGALGQNFALSLVQTPLVMVLEPGTTLERTAIERLVPSLAEPGVAAACGFIMPSRPRTPWERGLRLEHLLASVPGRPFVDSGCFTIYRTAVLRAHGGWPRTTPAGDQDVTWCLAAAGYEVRSVPTALSRRRRPVGFRSVREQFGIWARAFVQNARTHWPAVREGSPQLRAAMAVALWDGLVAPLVFLAILPLLVVLLGEPWLLLAYALELPALFAPLLAGTVPGREVGRALAGLPAFSMLRVLGALYLLRALALDWLPGRRLVALPSPQDAPLPAPAPWRAPPLGVSGVPIAPQPWSLGADRQATAWRPGSRPRPEPAPLQGDVSVRSAG